MLVALAVLVVAMAIVTNVFSVTTKTTSTSAAIADAEALARNFAYQIEKDLEGCDPADGILVVHGRTQAAALREDNRQAGQYYRLMVGDPGAVPITYDPSVDPSGVTTNGTTPRDQYSDPRADILAFFTNRTMVSNAPATNNNPPDLFEQKLQQGAKVSLSQVVYGHAAIDTAVPAGSSWDFAGNLTHIEPQSGNTDEISPLPLDRWHLARRVALIDTDNALIDPRGGFTTDPDRFDAIVTGHSTDSRYAGDSITLNYDGFLSLFAPGLNVYTNRVGMAALHRPYGFPKDTGGYGNSSGSGDLRWTDASNEVNPIVNTLYPPSTQQRFNHVATVIENPPAALRDNLGVHMLPGCLWFQVEFLLPEDPRNWRNHPLPSYRRDTPRWVSVPSGETYVFVPDTEENRQLVRDQVMPNGSGNLTGTPQPGNNRLNDFAQVIPPTPPTNFNGPNTADNRHVRMWPYAIRVTVRVIDQRGRLETPIVRSVVHRFD